MSRHSHSPLPHPASPTPGPSTLGLHEHPPSGNGRANKRRRSTSPRIASSVPFPRLLDPPQSDYLSPHRSISHLIHSSSPTPQPSDPRPPSPRQAVYEPPKREREEERHDVDELEESGSDRSSDLAQSAVPPAFGGVREGWTYHLEIMQQPVRARACGFGDKDRRPLSPPPILRLWVRDAAGQLVHPDHIGTHFLLLMVDLWSADARQQRSVVMHPTSTGVRPQTPPDAQPPPPLFASSSRPGTATSSGRPDTAPASSWPGGANWRFASAGQSGFSASPATVPSPLTRGPGHDSLPNPLSIPSPQISGWAPPTPDRPGLPRAQSFAARQALSPPESGPRPTTAPSGRPPLGASQHPHPLTLPPLAAIAEGREARPTSSRAHLPSVLDPYRPSTASSSDPRPSWSTSSSHPADYATSSSHRPTSSSSAWHSSVSSATIDTPRPITASGAANIMWADRPSTAYSAYTGHRPSTSGSSNLHPISAPKQPWESPATPRHVVPYPSSSSEQSYPPYTPDSAYPPPHTPRLQMSAPAQGGVGSYSRVLVGSLCAVCSRLVDQEGRPGLFFFAHDLGVRTEGTFTLRFVLTDLTSLMTANTQPGDSTRVLAETFSNAFTVYSAKRFPGVIETTSLTRHFANQGVRLPTRQKRTKGESPAESGEPEDDD